MNLYSRCYASFPEKTTPPDTLEEGFLHDESFIIGSGVSYFVDNNGAPRRSIIGYYGSFSIEKKLFENFNVSSGIDGYTVPRSEIKLIGNINLNVLYYIPLGDKINIGLSTGLFTGFIQRKNSSGINSGALAGVIIRYKINKNFDAGVRVKYPFFTEANSIVLTNAFFSF